MTYTKSHTGVNKAMSLARTCIYWPGMEAYVTNFIKRCPKCIECSNVPVETLDPNAVPTGPWVKIGIDFFQDHLEKKGFNHCRLLQQVLICVLSGIFTSYQHHQSSIIDIVNRASQVVLYNNIPQICVYTVWLLVGLKSPGTLA